MPSHRFHILLTGLSILWTAPGALAQSATEAHAALPHLERLGQTTQLVVDGAPMLILGGELHNSSSSSVENMNTVYPRLAAMHLNTVLTPVAWETIEPTEGAFDFHVVDGLLDGARSNHVKLVVLWFGAWKNTFSSYVPAWVKRDETRFPRVELSDGRGTERLSPFSVNARTSDAKAFAALMRHLREVDGTQHTVLMVQVENEVGVLPESRDHSKVAGAAFAAPVPAPLMHMLATQRDTLNEQLHAAWISAGAHTNGSWTEVFGPSPLTDDLFMAWQFASYIQAVAAAGKAEYPLPMYTNAALIRPRYQPGQYNSGGPLPESFELWKNAAPALDFLSPDIYFNEFSQWADAYTRPGNPLFIPESQLGQIGAANALYAFGKDDAIGFSVFGIDDQGNQPLDLVGITHAGDHSDDHAIAASFAELGHLMPELLHAQQTGTAVAAIIESEAQRAARVGLGDYTAQITRTGAPSQRIGALFLQTATDEYLVAGVGDAQVVFTTDKPGAPIVGIESIDEEFYADGARKLGRRVNGDESGQGQMLKLSADDLAQGRIYRVRLYRYR